MFLSGRFVQEVTPESNGRYYICFDNSQPMQLVAVGAGTVDSVSLVIPSVGEDISSVCASLKYPSESRSSASIAETTPVNYLCYGNFSYTPGESLTDSTTATLTMMNKNVRIHIVIKHLLTQLGDGKYTVKLRGFRDALAFDGSIKGDSIEYEPHGSFDSNGTFSTDIINAMPTADGEHVTFSLYKDGYPIFTSNSDSDGSLISLQPEDDKVIVVDVGKMGVNLNVIPWSDVNGSTIFY
ncbi:FimB/Mfa2 family fimbrial subunit [Prevotella herbatica]|nr:FimB/Mfa2 family fimbrial subunit [Prevotella herbatica]